MASITGQTPDLSPQFDPQMAEPDRAIIKEELTILETVLSQASRKTPSWQAPDMARDLLDLRDSLGEAHQEDIAQIVAQMDGLAHLSHHYRDEDAELPLDLNSPYFGHLRVEQEDRIVEVLLSGRSMMGVGITYPLIDWRHAPISRLYYTYREGDEYEEEFAEKVIEGVVLTRRQVIILHGRLLRIECLQGTYQLQEGLWRKVELQAPKLEGGAGTAFLPGTAQDLTLGGATDNTVGEDKHLRAITGLIDSQQFDVITRPESGVVVIDGGAGSGKTTIALHRMAYLTFQDKNRFRPQAMLGVVFSKALAAYVERLLPSLGVKDCRIEVFEDFTENLRKRHFPHLPGEYCDTTPFPVVTFKHHPAALALLKQKVKARVDHFRSRITSKLENTESLERALQAWDGLDDLPLATRLAEFTKWVSGKYILPGVGKFGKDWLAQRRLVSELEGEIPEPSQPVSLAAAIWEEAFLEHDELLEITQRLAPGEFSAEQVDTIHNWCARAYQLREEHRIWREEGGATMEKEEDGEESYHPQVPQFDREDDSLLLLLYREVIGPLRSSGKKPLRFQHLMIDEAQDFSPLDLRLLVSLVAEPHSITLAGDTDQRMILHNAFDSWEGVLQALGLETTAITPLQVGYRSTEEIMAFAKAVLGPLATERAWVPVRTGQPVVMLRFTQSGQAIAKLSDSLLELQRREPGASIALVARYPAQADMYFDGLKRTELPRLKRVADQDFSFLPGVEVTDVNQVKGLEFDYVILLDVDQATYPDDTASRYLLHIGATRAAHQLWLVSLRNPSPMVPEEIPSYVL